MTALELDKKFDDNHDDILEYFDLSSIKKPNHTSKKLDIDMPVWMINSLKKEAKHIGITVQAVIKMWLAQRLADKTTI